jgi:predicted TIM-barrel fold metal-dependent hydrolase
VTTIDRLIFSTDYPFGLTRLPPTDFDRRLFAADNARTLFGIKGGTRRLPRHQSET